MPGRNVWRLLCCAVAAVLLGACTGGGGEMQDSWSVKVGDPLPAFQLTGADGKAFGSDDLKGKVAVIALWATWCPPCRAELPVLDEKIYRPLKDKGVVVVGINAAEEQATVESFAKDSGLSYPLLVDQEGSFSSAVGGQYLPRSLIVGKDGKIKNLHAGFDPRQVDKLVAEIEGLAAEK